MRKKQNKELTIHHGWKNFEISPSEMAEIFMNKNFFWEKKYFWGVLKTIPWLFQVFQVSQSPDNPDHYFSTKVRDFWY